MALDVWPIQHMSFERNRLRNRPFRGQPWAVRERVTELPGRADCRCRCVGTRRSPLARGSRPPGLPSNSTARAAEALEEARRAFPALDLRLVGGGAIPTHCRLIRDSGFRPCRRVRPNPAGPGAVISIRLQVSMPPAPACAAGTEASLERSGAGRTRGRGAGVISLPGDSRYPIEPFSLRASIPRVGGKIRPPPIHSVGPTKRGLKCVDPSPS